MSKNNPKRTISFKVDHIDPLGQGVYKENEDIFFIPKTLPNESGHATVLKSKKGVNFAVVAEISQKSDKRVDPDCPHFSECGGCQYLHTSYENELTIKNTNFKKILAPLDVDNKVEIISADNRLNYRNRVQLHYDKKQNKLGFRKIHSQTLVEVPQCKIIKQQLQESFSQLYENQKWKDLCKKRNGHIELYHYDGKLSVKADAPYAHLGFTQVNEEMNLKMQDFIQGILVDLEIKNCLDLFGGNGNLSSKISQKNVFCEVVDSMTHSSQNTDNQVFHEVDLYADNIVSKLTKSVQSSHFDLIILDPPRSGFKELGAVCQSFNSKYVIYISCHPFTMIRDLKELMPNHLIKRVGFFDLFPATHHMESFAVLEKL